MTRIASVKPHPISVPLQDVLWTAHEELKSSSVIVVEVRTDTDELWHEGKVMLGFDADERLIRKLPHDFAEKAVWRSRYPHHDTTSAADAIEALRGSGVPDELIARMMGGNAAAQFGVALSELVPG